MRFPIAFNHSLVEWKGRPLRPDVSLGFRVTNVTQDAPTDYRLVHAVIYVGDKEILLGQPSVVRLNELGISGQGDKQDPLCLKPGKILGRVARFQTSESCAGGFRLEAYFDQHELADLIWTYRPAEGQPRCNELLVPETVPEFTLMAEISAYQRSIYGAYHQDGDELNQQPQAA